MAPPPSAQRFGGCIAGRGGRKKKLRRDSVPSASFPVKLREQRGRRSKEKKPSFLRLPLFKMHIFSRLFFKTARPSFRSFWKKKTLSSPPHTHTYSPKTISIKDWKLSPVFLVARIWFCGEEEIFRKCTRCQFVRSPLSSHPFSCRKKNRLCRRSRAADDTGDLHQSGHFFAFLREFGSGENVSFFCFSSLSWKRQDLISHVF